jgi:REP element-mobilizing transposase RayT
MSYYERKLPHWHPEGAALFVTWRLHGSLPATVQREASSLQVGRAFVQIDRYLDRTREGPRWLADERIASMVTESLLFAEQQLRLYGLRAWVVMANHVHVVVLPHVPLARITRAVKGFTARRANQMLCRSGKPFWQQESFDHWARTHNELERIVRYVELNPVKAGLVSRPEDWHWSSAAVG